MYITIKADLSEAFDFIKRLRKNKEPALVSAVNHIARWQRQRFISISALAGDTPWKRLKKSTIKRKIRMGIARNPRWKLRESDTLLNAIGTKREDDSTYAVGFVKEARGPKKTYRGKRASQIARYHNLGTRTVPRRPLPAMPPPSTIKEIRKKIRKELGLKP